jgi:hypothetical protein
VIDLWAWLKAPFKRFKAVLFINAVVKWWRLRAYRASCDNCGNDICRDPLMTTICDQWVRRPK